MQKIYSLQYLRAFAAIWVLLTHVLQLCDVRPNDVFWAGQWEWIYSSYFPDLLSTLRQKRRVRGLTLG